MNKKLWIEKPSLTKLEKIKYKVFCNFLIFYIMWKKITKIELKQMRYDCFIFSLNYNSDKWKKYTLWLTRLYFLYVFSLFESKNVKIKCKNFEPPTGNIVWKLSTFYFYFFLWFYFFYFVCFSTLVISFLHLSYVISFFYELFLLSNVKYFSNINVHRLYSVFPLTCQLLHGLR